MYEFFVQLDAGDSENSDDDDDTQRKSKVYVPPKVTAVPYGELSLFWGSRCLKIKHRVPVGK